MNGLPRHGVGRALHEWPTVPTVYCRMARERLREGQVITIEPHIALGAGGMVTAADTWTLKIQDGSIAAAYEHTIIVTQQQPIPVTAGYIQVGHRGSFRSQRNDPAPPPRSRCCAR